MGDPGTSLPISSSTAPQFPAEQEALFREVLQLLNDKQSAELAASVGEAQQASAAEEPVEVSIEAVSEAPEFPGEAASEDISMEEVLGPGTRKKAASAESPAEEVEHQTY